MQDEKMDRQDAEDARDWRSPAMRWRLGGVVLEPA
jgi:hypothetical protein